MTDGDPDLGAVPPYEHDLTPDQVERQLRWLYNAQGRAGLALRRARDAEVTAKLAWEKRRRTVMLAPDTPKVTRGGYTVDERDCYVDDKCGDLRFGYEVAKAVREAAEDHVKTLRDQSMIVMRLSNQVETLFNMVGRAER